ncbi:MAG TPA: hypothetical protein VF213_15715, partial [Dongiaceae bacterium]
ARRVILDLAMREVRLSPGAPGKMEVELTVEDDGRTGAREPAVRSGMGLLGMRERVASLGGRLSFEAGRSTGSVLRVAIPVAPAAAREHGRELTA